MKDGEWKTYNRKGIVTSSTTYKDGVDVNAAAAAAQKKAEDKKASDQQKKNTPKPAPVNTSAKKDTAKTATKTKK